MGEMGTRYAFLWVLIMPKVNRRFFRRKVENLECVLEKGTISLKMKIISTWNLLCIRYFFLEILPFNFCIFFKVTYRLGI